MKKFVSIFLLICLAFTFFSVQAFAETDYSPYVERITVQKGDSVVKLCKARDLDYSEDRTAILIINGVPNELCLETLAIGQTIYLPNSDEDAKAIVALHDQNGPANAIEYKVKKGDTMFKICSNFHLNYNYYKEIIKRLNGWENDDDIDGIQAGHYVYLPLDVPLLSAVSTAQPPIEGDVLEYYLVKHTMAADETVEEVSEALGAKYSYEIEAIIKAVNGVNTMKKFQAGETFLFPSATADNAAYAIYSHTIVGGDTAGKLCKSYGVNFADVEDLLAALNPDLDLDAIPRGGKIYLAGKVTPSYKAAPPAAAPAAAAEGAAETAEDSTYNGLYVEKTAGKATIEVSGDAALSTVTVLWSNNAAEKNEWVFHGTFTAGGLLMYDDCTKTAIVFNTDGSSARTVDYENGSGYIYILNDVAVWHDNQEDIARDSSFAKN